MPGSTHEREMDRANNVMPAIEVSQVCKSFRDTAAVIDLSFNVARGEVFGMVEARAEGDRQAREGGLAPVGNHGCQRRRHSASAHQPMLFQPVRSSLNIRVQSPFTFTQ